MRMFLLGSLTLPAKPLSRTGINRLLQIGSYNLLVVVFADRFFFARNNQIRLERYSSVIPSSGAMMVLCDALNWTSAVSFK